MSDLRPRRRARDTVVPLGGYQQDSLPVDHFEEKEQRSAFSRVLSANPSSLWNSAQETFSSIPNSFYTTARGDEEPFTAPQSSFVPDSLLSAMPCRDRTGEFQATARAILNRNAFVPPPNRKEQLTQSIQFNQCAKKIGRDLALACAKMEKLTDLTKRKSVFEDRTEVDNLARVVKEDMISLNRQITALDAIAKGHSVHHQTEAHASQVLVGLQSKLATVTNDYKSMMERRVENQKEQKTRRDKFSSQADLISALPTTSSASNVRSLLLQEEEDVRRRNSANGNVALDIGAMMGGQQMSLHDDSLAYAQSRSNAMETIEKSISELGQVFSQLARLVSEQGESIMRIDSNVDETALNVDMAHSELVKYFHNISQNRWLMIKVFGILIVFFVVFVLFLT